MPTIVCIHKLPLLNGRGSFGYQGGAAPRQVNGGHALLRLRRSPALAFWDTDETKVAMSANIHLPPGASPARGRVVRDRIMRAAYRLFVERGFDGVSIEQIADAAGLSRRTIYNKFASKAEIYRVAFEPALARLELAASVSPSSSNDPQDVLCHYMSAACALLRCPELIEVLRVLVYDADRHPWLAQAYVERVRIPIRSRFADEITRLVTLGALPDHDVRILTERFFATLLGLLAFPRLLQLDARDGDTAAAAFMRESVESLFTAWQENEFGNGAREASRPADLPPPLPDRCGTCHGLHAVEIVAQRKIDDLDEPRRSSRGVDTADDPGEPGPASSGRGASLASDWRAATVSADVGSLPPGQTTRGATG